MWAISLMVMHSFGEEGLFDAVDIHTYEQKIYFFHKISNFLTIFWVLLHCIHPDTSFVNNLLSYDGDTVVVLVLRKRRID